MIVMGHLCVFWEHCREKEDVCVKGRIEEDKENKIKLGARGKWKKEIQYPKNVLYSYNLTVESITTVLLMKKSHVIAL